MSLNLCILVYTIIILACFVEAYLTTIYKK